MKTGRNDPCPCGSGKKHKNCCLSRSGGAPAPREDGPAAALSWLRQHYRKGLARAVEDFYAGAGLDPERIDRMTRLPEGLQSMVTINTTEWLLAESEIEIQGERRRAMDLVLGPGGPPLTPEARRWLEGLAGHPLRLYEVQEAVPGEGVWVKDATVPRARRRWVTERTASQSLVRFDVLGGRLVPVGTEWHFSGALYPIPGDDLSALREALRAAERAGEPPSGPIARCWLRFMTAPPAPLPELVDAGTGDPILLVTDHYEVGDWEALAAVLALQPEVEGDRENGWVRLEQVQGASYYRSKLALNPGKGNRLQAFARTLRRAEEGAAWLQKIAGRTLTYRTREISDPMARLGPDASAAPRPSPALSPEIHRELYRNWPEEPIPALGGRTPREAVRTRAGRLKVIDLLKDYERNEQRMSREQGRKAVSFAFLWEELGIEPPE